MRTINKHAFRWYQLVFLLLSLTLVYTTSTSANPPFQMTDGGMQYKELRTGDGDPVLNGQIVRIHLVGWIDENGQRGKELFNSRRDKGPISFVVGTDKVLPAFNEGVLGMKPGARRLLMVPPAFAYGERGVDEVIPPDTSLVLLIDLLSVESD